MRRDHDYYPTPSWVVRKLFDAAGMPRDVDYLDPWAGEGDLLRAIPQGHAYRLEGWEIRPSAMKALRSVTPYAACLDTFTQKHPGRWAIIANPPFSRAFEAVRWAVEPRRSPVVAMLLRLGMLASKGRASWLRVNRPDVYVLPQRPSFTADGKTDRYDYAWFIWTDDIAATGRIEWLEVGRE